MDLRADEVVMEEIWNNLIKSPDENHATFSEVDITDLWESGFVDTEKYSLEDWVKIFEPHKNADGDYVLTKEELFEKEKYRYTGEIMIPFEPLLINEGKYTDEGLQELIDMSIYPSCSLGKKELQEFFETFKETYRGDDDLITMNMEGKRQISELINESPSPTRRRELMFDALFRQHIEEIAKGNVDAFKATPEQAAQVQISTFSTLPSSRSEAASKELKGIEKRKDAPQATGGGDEGVSLKNVKKSRKGFKG